MNSRRFRSANPNLVSEIIDGEAVIVNLEKGLYYSLAKSGAEIWDALQAGASDTDIVDVLLTRYSADRTVIEAAVADLIRQLKEEGVIVENPGAAPGPSLPGAAAGSEKLPFECPALQKYTDLESILMLDPIHEVDETGWPSAKPAS